MTPASTLSRVKTRNASFKGGAVRILRGRHVEPEPAATRPTCRPRRCRPSLEL